VSRSKIGHPHLKWLPCPHSGRIKAEVFDGLVVLGKGIAEGRGFLVKPFCLIAIRPVILRRRSKKDHCAHGPPQVGSCVAFHLHQIPCHFVKKEPRGVDMPPECLYFIIFDQPCPCMGSAGTNASLVLDRRAPLPEIYRSGKTLCGRSLTGTEHLPNLIRFFRIVSQIRIIRNPPHPSFFYMIHLLSPSSKYFYSSFPSKVNLPRPEDCVVIASKGGEAVRFPARRQAGKALECGSFRLWKIVPCIKLNVFIGLA